MTKRRRKYTQEFKEEAVKLVVEKGYRITEAAKNLGIHPNLLSRWKREYENDISGVENAASSATFKAELNRLRKENKQLKQEREVLKRRLPSSPGNKSKVSFYRYCEEGILSDPSL